MLVCHCKAVNDGRIREAIRCGAQDEFDVADACGAGTVCGGCVPLVSRILDEEGCPLPAALRRRAAEAAPQASAGRVTA